MDKERLEMKEKEIGTGGIPGKKRSKNPHSVFFE